MATKEEALKALKAIAEASTVDRRLTGTIISSKGRHVTVALDGESVSVSAYRGAFEPSVGVRVTIERVAGMSVYRVVGVADDALIANDQNVNDYEYRGTLLYYPLALEAVNDAAYNLGNELEITLYNVQAIDSDSNFVYVENATLDLSASVPFADSRWAIIYLNLTDSTLDVYDHPSTATPIGEWVDAVNGMLSTVAEAVPVLAVRLDTGMAAWTDVYRVIRRGYLFGSKRIIRIPVPMQPNIGTVITDAYYQVVQDNGADKVSRANLNFADSPTVTVSVTDDGIATTSVILEAVPLVGADAVTDGAAGIVPQPLMGDEGKYLRGDGTWQLPTSPLTVTDETVTVTPTNTLTVDPADFAITDEGGGVVKLEFIGTAEAAFSVTDGTTTVDPVSEIEFSSAFEVTDGDDGIAQIGLANTPVYSFGISGDSGSGTITDGETLVHVGGSGIATAVSGNIVTTALNINGLTEEPSIAAGDKIPYYDVSASANRYIKYGDLGITNIDTDAIHDNVAGEINAITEKTLPVNNDILVIEDSEASYAKKRVKVGNLPSGGGGGGTAITPTTETLFLSKVVHHTTIASSGVTSIDVTTGLTGYKHLKVYIKSRNASSGIDVSVIINNDTTAANYRVQRSYGENGAGVFSAQSVIPTVRLSDSGSLANNFGTAEINFLFADGSSEKMLAAQFISRANSTYTYAGTLQAGSAITAAINRLTFNVAGVNGYATGTEIIIVGYKEFTLVSGVTGGGGAQVETTTITTNATPTELAFIPVPENSCITIAGEIVGSTSGYSAVCGGTFSATFRRATAGSVTLVGSVTTDVKEDSSGSPTFTVAADTVAETASIRVTGVASETWNWKVSYRSVVD